MGEIIKTFFDVIDEAILKTLFLFIRLLQIFGSIFIAGAVAQLSSDVVSVNNALSDAHVAVLSIGCVAAVWSLSTSLITCCGGTIFFNADIAIDFIIGLCFIVSAVLLRSDCRSRCADFNTKYFGSNSGFSYRDCNLIRAVYAFTIINT
jgi:hypothetical protein